MGAFATAVQDYLCESLAASVLAVDWETEYRIAGTPVDVAGVSDSLSAVHELLRFGPERCIEQTRKRRFRRSDGGSDR